jgi:hypothetical protein
VRRTTGPARRTSLCIQRAIGRRLRDCDLEIALREARADIGGGRVVHESVDDHLKHLDAWASAKLPEWPRSRRETTQPGRQPRSPTGARAPDPPPRLRFSPWVLPSPLAWKQRPLARSPRRFSAQGWTTRASPPPRTRGSRSTCPMAHRVHNRCPEGDGCYGGRRGNAAVACGSPDLGNAPRGSLAPMDNVSIGNSPGNGFPLRRLFPIMEREALTGLLAPFALTLAITTSPIRAMLNYNIFASMDDLVVETSGPLNLPLPNVTI